MIAFIRHSGCPLCDKVKELLPPDARIVDVDTHDGMVELCYTGLPLTIPVILDEGNSYTGQEAIEYLLKKGAST